MDKEELKKVLELHQRWLNNEEGGESQIIMGGRYGISQSGNVYSLVSAGGSTFRNKPYLLKPRKTTNGYTAYLIDRKNVLAHRLVAQAFLGLDTRDKKQIVHHLNGIRSDNRASNLMVCDYSFNNRNSKKKSLKAKLGEFMTAEGIPVPQREVIWK